MSPLADLAMSPLAVQLMLKLRLKTAGLPAILSPHSFRVLVFCPAKTRRSKTSSTWRGTLPPRTAQIYDSRYVSPNVVERIPF